VNEMVKAGYQIAKEVAEPYGGKVICSMGPILSSNEDEHIIENAYKVTIDAFLSAGATDFIFETFDDLHWIKVLSDYIKNKRPESVIMASVSINSFGYTKSGISYHNILKDFSSITALSAFGFNCSIGAGHMRKLLTKLKEPYNQLLILPNAGYPEIIMDRQHYQDNSAYFADQICEIYQLGGVYLGGCCGTTPKHIEAVANRLKKAIPRTKHTLYKGDIRTTKEPLPNIFREKLMNNEFVIAVELDPPYGFDISKLMESANILKATKTDIITLADSPLGRTRVDAIMMASKIKREVGIDVMPHLCCRDKNAIAIKGMMMAAHIEDIRNVLLVTGDPIPQAERGNVSGVFNVNAIQLIDLVNQLNREHIEGDSFFIGGAFDPKKRNMDREIERILRKKEAGANFLLTQPIYNLADMEVLERIRQETGIKILAGILPLVSYKNARFIHNEFSGMAIPEDVISAFSPEMSREEGESVGINIAINMAKKLKDRVDGLYFMTPFNRAGMIKKIIEQI